MDVSGSYLAVTMRNIVKSTLQGDDELREPLKPWRKRLREICTRENAIILDTIASDNATAVDRYKTFVSDKEEIVNPTVTVEEDYEMLRLQNKKVLDSYLTCMDKMFTSYSKLEEKLSELEELEAEFGCLSCLEVEDRSAEGLQLQTSIQHYLQKKYADSTVAQDYKDFKDYYNQWRKLRGIILQAHVAHDLQGGPYCSICTNEKVNMALVPCGHTYCTNCGQKQKNTCFICRTTVKEKLRIFLT